jgi:hypothetical protein
MTAKNFGMRIQCSPQPCLELAVQPRLRVSAEGELSAAQQQASAAPGASARTAMRRYCSLPRNGRPPTSCPKSARPSTRRRSTPSSA